MQIKKALANLQTIEQEEILFLSVGLSAETTKMKQGTKILIIKASPPENCKSAPADIFCS